MCYLRGETEPLHAFLKMNVLFNKGMQRWPTSTIKQCQEKLNSVKTKIENVCLING